ncbi:MAG: 50S ribosomal protein L18 [Candidatus Thorarchaeota archaeon]
MAKNARYRVHFRRRREGKTNYQLRRALVISRKKRIVIRRSNRNIMLQLISSHVEGDRTYLTVNSRELEQYQWQGSTSNLPASYLTGFLFGKKIQTKGLAKDEFILDIGLARKFYGSKIFTALKGAVDAGLDIKYSEEIFPSDNRIKGEHIAEYAKMLSKENKDKYNQIFSKYKPEKLPEMFEKVKNSISAIK